MSFGGSLTRIRKSRGISRKDFAEQLEIPYTTLRNYETDQREPGHKLLIRMASLLSVSVDELIENHPTTKTASLYSSEAMHLAKDYDGLDGHGQRVVRLVADEELARCAEEDKAKQALAAVKEQKRQMEAGEEIAPDVVEMLVYVNPAAAGTPLYAESDFERLEFRAEDVPRGADFGIRISGKSMEPTVMDGSIVWVRKRLDFLDGTMGVFMLNDSAVCKRFFKEGDKVRLESDNPEFGPVPVTEFDTFVPVGEVIGTI